VGWGVGGGSHSWRRVAATGALGMQHRSLMHPLPPGIARSTTKCQLAPRCSMKKAPRLCRRSWQWQRWVAPGATAHHPPLFTYTHTRSLTTQTHIHTLRVAQWQRCVAPHATSRPLRDCPPAFTPTLTHSTTNPPTLEKHLLLSSPIRLPCPPSTGLYTHALKKHVPQPSRDPRPPQLPQAPHPPTHAPAQTLEEHLLPSPPSLLPYPAPSIAFPAH
jgi:hypothetical protein